LFTIRREIQDRIRIDIEFVVFQGALERVNAKQSCKLMRQHRVTKSAENPLLEMRGGPSEYDLQRESNSNPEISGRNIGTKYRD
jgi:hypothetical protein